jgi:RHS repeat-associated protein
VGITDPTGDTTRYVYDPAGRRVQTRSTASAIRSDLAYDPLGRLDTIASTRADGSARPSVRYPSYDAAGNRLARLDELGSTGYAYDALHRLVTADPPGESGSSDAIHYAYDRAGNRLFSGAQNGSGQWTAPYQSLVYETPASGGPSQRLSEVRSDSGALLDAFVYDANGNPSQWQHPGLRTLRWDALDRLVSISGSFVAQYRYDPLGRRIEKTELGATLRYQYDGLDVVAEYSVGAGNQNSLAATYVFGPGIDEPIKIRRGSTTAAYHADGLGSILAVSSVTSTGSTDLLTYRYDAFGVLEASTGTLDSTYTFTGRELDASGLYYYRARYYLPSAGRFLTPDPIGLEGGLNAYAYVGSNPVNFTDPFGLVPMTPKGFANLERAAPPQAPTFSVSRNIGNLFIRSFAPFERFGGGFEGDNRGFTTDLGVMSRISVRIPIDLSTLELLGDPKGQSSRSSCLSDFCRALVSTATGQPIREQTVATGRPTVGVSNLKGGALAIDVAGANPLLPSADIDLRLTLQRNNNGLTLSLTGDAFPNAEVFFIDQSGHVRMFLEFSTSGSAGFGPYLYLPGNSQRDMGGAFIEGFR